MLLQKLNVKNNRICFRKRYNGLHEREEEEL